MEVSILSDNLELYGTDIELSADVIIKAIKTLPKEHRCKKAIDLIFKLVNEKLDCTAYDL